jgi:hypothetical protein
MRGESVPGSPARTGSANLIRVALCTATITYGDRFTFSGPKFVSPRRGHPAELASRAVRQACPVGERPMNYSGARS